MSADEGAVVGRGMADDEATMTEARETRETPALEVRNLEAGYGHATVLRDVSLSAPASSVTALLGPNGAGKTTLLRTVSGLLTPSRGSIHMDGEDISGAKPHRRFAAGMCHVPEGRGIFRSLTVSENLVVQSRKGTEEAAIERAAEAFPILGERLDQRAGTLSGGEQQMLAVSSAYVRDPRLILVDEVSLGLAPLIVDAIFDFLERVVQEGTALLLVDQYVTRALALATRAYLLRRGEIVFAGTSEALLESDVFEQYLGTESGAAVDADGETGRGS